MTSHTTIAQTQTEKDELTPTKTLQI